MHPCWASRSEFNVGAPAIICMILTHHPATGMLIFSKKKCRRHGYTVNGLADTQLSECPPIWDLRNSAGAIRVRQIRVREPGVPEAHCAFVHHATLLHAWR